METNHNGTNSQTEKKDNSDSQNYRLISLTKLLMQDNGKNQTTLSPNYNVNSEVKKGTIDHLIRLKTNIREAFIKCEYLITIFFDLEKVWYEVELQSNVIKELPSGIDGSLYVDDLMICFKSKHFHTIERELQQGLRKPADGQQ